MPAQRPVSGNDHVRDVSSGESGPERHAVLPERLVPTVIVTATLDSLLGRDDVPGELLTRLTGGRLKVSANTARRLVDEHGADVRLVVLDETGQILGVGRRSRKPPGWLHDAMLARDQVCRAPGCQVAARLCHGEHAWRWSDGGPTDVDNVAMTCATDNHAKERDGWDVVGGPDGTRSWHHPRSGLTIRTVPSTRRLTLPQEPRTALHGLGGRNRRPPRGPTARGDP